jgi:hypothetical protein
MNIITKLGNVISVFRLQIKKFKNVKHHSCHCHDRRTPRCQTDRSQSVCERDYVACELVYSRRVCIAFTLEE